MIELRAESRGRTWHERFAEVAERSVRKADAIRYDIRLQTVAGHLSRPAARDLVQIAIAVHLADRQIRRSFRSGHRPRRMSVVVPLEEPDRWTPHRALLEELASFATQDAWTMSFPLNSAKRRAESTDPAAAPSVVALFSGGLDLLCGAAYLANRGEVVGLLTHSPPSEKTVRALTEPLPARIGGRNPSSYRPLSISLRPVQRDENGSRRNFQEFSRRSRPFFYLGLASAAAMATGAKRVQMSENGALGASLPIRRSNYGAFMTRQGHSFLMDGFQTLVHAAVPETSLERFENPFSMMTKGEACRHLKAAADLARRTLSCEYVGQQIARLRRWVEENRGGRTYSAEFRQCGLCVPCLVRRAAMRAAGLSDPDSDYFFQAPKVLRALRAGKSLFHSSAAPPLYEFANGHCLYIARFAEEILSMRAEDFAVQYLPELISQRPALIGKNRMKSAFDLQRRFARELLGFLDG